MEKYVKCQLNYILIKHFRVLITMICRGSSYL